MNEISDDFALDTFSEDVWGGRSRSRRVTVEEVEDEDDIEQSQQAEHRTVEDGNRAAFTQQAVDDVRSDDEGDDEDDKPDDKED